MVMQRRARALPLLLSALACGSARGTKLSGVFLSMYEQDVTFSAARWAEELDAMHAVGIDTVIVGESASNTWPNYSYSVPQPHRPFTNREVYYSNSTAAERVRVHAFWPTKLASTIPGYSMMDTGYEPLEHILAAADARNMKVILGNADVPWVDQGGAQDWKMQAVLSHAILDELWALYSTHASLTGFYNAVELSCDVRNEKLGLEIAAQMFGPFADHVKLLRPSLRAVTSPYYRPANYSNPHTTQMAAAQWGEFWRKVLTNASNFDTIAPQDGVGAGHNNLTTVRAYLGALAKVTTELNRTLWSNVELFAPSEACAAKGSSSYCPASCVDRRPAPFERIEAQMKAEAVIADDGFLIAYEWHAYLSPSSTACNGASSISSPDWHLLAKEQYEKYKAYVKG